MGCGKSKVDIKLDNISKLLDKYEKDPMNYALDTLKLVKDKDQYRESAKRRIDELASKALALRDETPLSPRTKEAVDKFADELAKKIMTEEKQEEYKNLILGEDKQIEENKPVDENKPVEDGNNNGVDIAPEDQIINNELEPQITLRETPTNAETPQ